MEPFWLPLERRLLFGANPAPLSGADLAPFGAETAPFGAVPAPSGAAAPLRSPSSSFFRAEAPYRSRLVSLFGALLAPFGAAALSWSCSGSLNGSCTGSFLELTRLLSGGSFWSCSGSLDRSCSGSFLELIRILLELIRLPLERKLLLELRKFLHWLLYPSLPSPKGFQEVLQKLRKLLHWLL